MHNENINDNMRIPMSLYFYPENFVTPEVGDIIYCSDRVPKTVVKCEKNLITLQSLLGRRNTITFFDFNVLMNCSSTSIFKPCELESKNIYMMIDHANVLSVIFIKSIEKSKI